MADLPAKRSHTAETATTINTSRGLKALVASGDNPVNQGTKTVWIYTPDSGKGSWSIGTSLPSSRYAAVLKFDDRTGLLYYIGGSPNTTSKTTNKGVPAF
jgi:hypothetical protein